MTVFDIEESPGTWFEIDGGGRVQLRIMPSDVLRNIRKQTTRKKVDYKNVDGIVGRFEYTEFNEDLDNLLFWDYVIVAWENLLDANNQPIPCTPENKVLLMSRSVKFGEYIGECLKKLNEDAKLRTETLQKN